MKINRVLHIAILLVFFSSIKSYAQTPDSAGVYSIAAVMPSYDGGDEALYAFINQNIKYPKEALDQKKQGTVQMKIVIDEQGTVPSTKVMRGVCPSLDEEAQRVVKATSGKWLCGKVDDKPVKTYKYLKVSFKIDTSAIETTPAAKPKEAVSFIGGDEAFYNFIRKYIVVPNTVMIHPKFWGEVTVSVSFNSMNQITDVIVLKGPYKDLNEEGVRLIKLSQGKWLRTDSTKTREPVSAIITIPFNESMIDSNARKRFISENIILVARNTNPTFEKAYESYEGGNYDLAIMDLDDCIRKNENLDAALVIRMYCYMDKGNYPAACEDMIKLKNKPGMDSMVEELYFKYCADPKVLLNRHRGN